MLALSTSPRDALKAAKQLVGCFPHARPPEPEVYAGALASVLAQYPRGVVDECVDPRCGLAREREFPPTVACVVEWCDKQLAFHQRMAAHKPLPPEPARPEVSPHERAVASVALRKLFGWMQAPKEERGEPPTWNEAARELATQKQAAE